MLTVLNVKCIYLGNNMDSNNVYGIMSIELTNGSICDTAGNLLFYSNGLTIGNKNYDTLKNAIDFNPGFVTES